MILSDPMTIIYGRDNCSYCEAAKNLLDRKGYKYIYKNIEKDTEALAAFKRDFPHAKTVPQILHEYNRIGGYTELTQWLSTVKS